MNNKCGVTELEDGLPGLKEVITNYMELSTTAEATRCEPTR
jgi:hypothetical protein